LIWEQHPSNDRYKSEVFQQFFDEAVKSNMAFVIYEKSEDEIIGSTRFYDYDKKENSIAIGFKF
jgi:N-acetyltransferase